MCPYSPPPTKLAAFAHQKPATLNQVDPVVGTFYTILDTTPNVRLYYILVRHNETDVSKSLTARLTIDGRILERTWSMTHAPERYLYMYTYTDGREELIDTSDRTLVGYQTPLEGRSVKVELKTNTAMASGKAILGAVYYAKLV